MFRLVPEGALGMLCDKIRKVLWLAKHEGVGAVTAKLAEKLWEEAQHALILLNKRGPRFLCPCCGHSGPFLASKGQRHCKCPQCGARARHRLQKLILEELFSQRSLDSMSVLHIAPEAVMQQWLQHHSRRYVSTDLGMGIYNDSYTDQLSVVSDLRNLPFRDSSFNFVLCSHVLEHVKEDRQAIKEIYRVLSWEGIAILPVPIVAGNLTVEYNEPRPTEQYHVRAPGSDYFDRYTEAGFDVLLRKSDEFPEQYQVFCYEDRSRWSTSQRPIFVRQLGERHLDYVPVCQKKLPGKHAEQ